MVRLERRGDRLQDSSSFVAVKGMTLEIVTKPSLLARLT